MIRTSRLILRGWQEQDLAPFAALNANPLVMRYFPSILDRHKSDELAQRLQRQINENGYGFYAAHRVLDNQFIGFIGANQSSAELPFAPCVDIGWRLDHPFWGRGYATEGAKAVLHDSFTRCQLNEIVSMTPVSNLASEKVMLKLGMTKAANTFNHPSLKPNHPLSEHLLYRLSKDDWRAGLAE